MSDTRFLFFTWKMFKVLSEIYKLKEFHCKYNLQFLFFEYVDGIRILNID